MAHKLKIKSLHDAQAYCSCGWNITCTGERSKDYLIQEHKKHIKQEQNLTN